MTFWPVDMIKYTFGRIDLGFGSASSSTNLEDGFGSAVYQFINLIRSNIFMPVAITLLAFFILMEIWRLCVRTEGNSAGIQPIDIALIVLKYAFYYCLITVIPDMFEAVFNVCLNLSKEVENFFSNSYSTTLTSDFEKVLDDYNNMSWYEKLFPAMTAYLMYFVVAIADFVANAIIKFRILEILIYIAVSPLPMATLVSPASSQMGKHFLQNFVAICFQGVIITIVGRLGSIIITEFMDAGSVTGGWTIMLAMCRVMLACIAYIIVLFFTQRWAKQMVAA